MSYINDILNTTKIEVPWSLLSGCNILVTGATGLIGSCLIEVLMERPQRDYFVYAMGRNSQRMNKLFERYISTEGFHTIIGDVTEPLSTDLSFHYIIHVAGGAAPSEFAKHPVEVMKANINGVINLMEYGLTHNMHRFLYVSSGEVYGEGDGREFTEDYSGYVDCVSPRSCYPSSKRAAETLCVSYASEYGADVVIARPCHIYGPNFTENDNRVYAQFIRNVLQDEDIVLKSKGEQFRSWCYVVDCASAILHILLKGQRTEAYNIADDKSAISIKELANMVAAIGKKRVVIHIPEADERKGYNPVSKSVYSAEKLKLLGCSIEGDMFDKMRATIDFVKERSSKCLNSFR